MFKGLSGIKKLTLNYYNISSIHETAFKFKFLNTIELEGNNLEELDYYVLKSFGMAKEINLANNPWSDRFVCKYEQWCYIYQKSNSIEIETNCTYYYRN